MNTRTVAIALTMGALAWTGSATEYTFNWEKTFPDTGDDIIYTNSSGKTIAKFTLAQGNPVQDGSTTQNLKWLINQVDITPNAGDTVQFTGAPMTFFMTSAQSHVYCHADNTTVIFDNITTNRTTYWCTKCSGETVTWTGGDTFATTNWVLIAKGCDLADYEPTYVQQTGVVPKSGSWYNQEWKTASGKYEGYMSYVQQLVRSKDKLTFQYRTTTLQPPNDRYSVVVVKLELKQGDDGIYARAYPKTYRVYTANGDTATYGVGTNSKQFDVDKMEVGDDMAVYGLFVNDTTGTRGGGINTIKLQRIKPFVTYRFTNKCHFGAALQPMGLVRCEFTQPQNCTFIHQCPFSVSTTIAYRDFSGRHTVKNNIQGSGRIIYEATQKSTTNNVTLSATKENFMPLTGQHIVRGNPDIGAKMVVTIDSTSAERHLGASNNFFRVERGGELQMKLPTSFAQNATRTNTLLACDGGVISTCCYSPFRYGQQVVIDGGELFFRKPSDDATGYSGCFFNLMLKNGAVMNCEGALTEGALFRHDAGYGLNQAKIWVAGDTPSTNNVKLELMSDAVVVDSVTYGVWGTNTFCVASTHQADGSADFVSNGAITTYHGSAPYRCAYFRKTGDGTMLMNNDLALPNTVILCAGTLKFGKKSSGSYVCAQGTTKAPIAFEGGTLAAADEASMDFGVIERLTADSAIKVGANATFTFAAANAKAANWTSGKKLEITVPESSQIRFGTDQDALTTEQLSQIRLNGYRARINDRGYLKTLGFILILR